MKHLIRQVTLSIFHLFPDGDRASQPEGGGGGVGQRGGAADVLHPARPARRRRRPHPCSVSLSLSLISPSSLQCESSKLSHFHSSSDRTRP